MEPDDACITVYIYVYIYLRNSRYSVCVSVCPLLGTSQEVTLDSFHWIHDCVSCCSRSAPYQGHVDKKAYLCVTDKLLHTLLKGHGLRHRSNSGLAHRSKAQLPSTEDLQNRLQGARLPYSPHVWKPKARPNPTQSRHMRKPAGVPFHCAKLGHKSQRKHHNPRTVDSSGSPRGKAAHEG